jgi:cbb3-type cytochrome oxidase subunit 3
MSTTKRKQNTISSTFTIFVQFFFFLNLAYMFNKIQNKSAQQEHADSKLPCSCSHKLNNSLYQTYETLPIH